MAGLYKMEKCSECGGELGLRSYKGYCFKCYSKIWDSGFESTSEHAYEIGFKELVAKLKEKFDEKAAREIISEWGPLSWSCVKCGELLISEDRSKELSVEEKINILSQGCECGFKGVKPSTPKKFFS